MGFENEWTYCNQVLSDLVAEPFARLAVPPGFQLEDACAEVREAVESMGETFLQINPEQLRGREDLYRILSYQCRVEPAVATLEAWLREVHHYQSRVLVLAGFAPPETLEGILAEAKALVSATKDLDAPVKVLWVHDLRGAEMIPEFTYKVWPGRPMGVPLLDFTILPQTGLLRAMGNYVDLRIYWESCGHPSRIAKLTSRVEDLAPAIRVDADIDAVLDGLFDQVPLETLEEDGMGGFLRKTKVLQDMERALRKGTAPSPARSAVGGYEAHGILWQPPGTARRRLTPCCLAFLARNASHPLTKALGLDVVRARLLASRANPLLSQMVLFLGAQVELELLIHLRNEPSCETVLELLDMTEELRIIRDRSQVSSPKVPYWEDRLIDYATFGQLVKLNTNLDPRVTFPIPKQQLWAAAVQRNNAAHGQPIQWKGIRRLIETTYQLCR